MAQSSMKPYGVPKVARSTPVMSWKWSAKPYGVPEGSMTFPLAANQRQLVPAADNAWYEDLRVPA